MITATPVVLLSGPEDDQASEPKMKFRLIYEGELRPTGNDPVGGQRNPLAKHKQEIRKAFHLQLKRLWTTDKFLRDAKAIINSYGEFIMLGPHSSDGRSLSDMIADQYEEFGYRFVPLVREEWSLLCSLRVLFLRRDFPGAGVITSAGDIDNRIKTLIVNGGVKTGHVAA